MLSKPPCPGWVSISPSADRRRAGEASTGLQSAPGLVAQTCSCVGAASLGRKLISALEAMPEVGPVLSACSDEASEVMWEVAAEAGSKPRFLCWPGVTLLSLLCSVAPTSLAYTKLWLYKGRQVLLGSGPAPSSAPWWLWGHMTVPSGLWTRQGQNQTHDHHHPSPRARHP